MLQVSVFLVDGVMDINKTILLRRLLAEVQNRVEVKII